MSVAIAYMLDDGGGLAPGVCLLPELTVDLGDGLTGYAQRTFDDCLRAATATATQTDYDLAEIEAGPPYQVLPHFAIAHGLCMEAVDLQDPPDTPWLAISNPINDGGERFTHATAYRGSELLFDPFAFVRPDGGRLRDELPLPGIAEGFLFFPESSPN